MPEQQFESLEDSPEAGSESIADVQGTRHVPCPYGTEAMKKLYTDCNGDLELLAKKTGSCLYHMKKDPPCDADDFASKILAGRYTRHDGSCDHH